MPVGYAVFEVVLAARVELDADARLEVHGRHAQVEGIGSLDAEDRGVDLEAELDRAVEVGFVAHLAQRAEESRSGRRG